MPRRIAFLIFPDFPDPGCRRPAVGLRDRRAPRAGAYELKVIAAHAGSGAQSSGASVNAGGLPRAAGIDTAHRRRR